MVSFVSDREVVQTGSDARFGSTQPVNGELATEDDDYSEAPQNLSKKVTSVSARVASTPSVGLFRRRKIKKLARRPAVPDSNPTTNQPAASCAEELSGTLLDINTNNK